jgi:hypothetical protein
MVMPTPWQFFMHDEGPSSTLSRAAGVMGVDVHPDRITVSEAAPNADQKALMLALIPFAHRLPQAEMRHGSDARMREPEQGPFLNGLERRLTYPTSIEKSTDAGERIVEVLTKYDSPDLLLGYESLAFEFGAAREHVACGLSGTEAVALLLETVWAVAQARPVPSFKSRQRLSPRWPEGRCERP